MYYYVINLSDGLVVVYTGANYVDTSTYNTNMKRI